MATEKRLIDANALVAVISKHGCLNALVRFINNAPTVHAVEVVRCKDCKHWSYIPGLDKCPHCMVFCGLHSKAYQTKSDDFCSYGERRTDHV